MLVLAAAELPTIVRQHDLDSRTVGVEGRQDVVVEQLHRRDRQLVGVEPGRGVAAVTADRRLQVNLSAPLQGANKEGIDRYERAGVRCLYMPLAELRAEPLQ